MRVTKVYVEWRYGPTQSQLRHYMLVSRRFHCPANLPSGENNRYPLEAGKAPEPVRPLAMNRKIYCPYRHRIVALAGGLVTTPTELTPPLSKLNVIVCAMLRNIQKNFILPRVHLCVLCKVLTMRHRLLP